VLPVLAVTLAAASPLGVFGHTLARFDRDTLEPVGPQTQVIEPHAPGVLSPDGKRLAMGISKTPPPGQRSRVGLWIVDPATMRPVREVSTGIAADFVAYPGVVAALLQGGELVIVDPDTGEITARHRTGADLGCGERPAELDGAAVFPLIGPGAKPRLAVVDARGSVRTVRLRLRYRLPSNACGGFGLAADRAGRRAFAFTGDGRVAELSLRTLRVRYHRTDVRASRCARCLDSWRVAWVPGVGLAVVGQRSTAAGRGRNIALGLHVLDSRTWRTRWRNRTAKDVAFSGSAVVTVGAGVDAYEPDGRRRFHALGRRAVGWWQVAAGRLYADDGRRLNVIDLANGLVRMRLAATNFSFWLLED
jgi:hypothetical protein